jgi:hypothetical protein
MRLEVWSVDMGIFQKKKKKYKEVCKKNSKIRKHFLKTLKLRCTMRHSVPKFINKYISFILQVNRTFSASLFLKHCSNSKFLK